MWVEDYYSRGWRVWMRLHDKGGEPHETPCSRNLETYIDAYRVIRRRTTALYDWRDDDAAADEVGRILI